MDLLPDDDDRVWRALAHPLRRALLDVLRDGQRTTGELVTALGQDRHVVMQHLNVLREAELVIVRAAGRRRINHLNPAPIQRIYEHWVSRYETNWMAALVGLEDTVERAHREKGHDVG